MQLALDFAAERSAQCREPAALEARIRRALVVPVDLLVTNNRRSMISTRRRGDRLVVRVHRIFLDAPDSVVEELLCYLSEGDAKSSRQIGRYIEANRHRIERRARRIALSTRGGHHDLAAIFDEVVTAHFPDGIGEARITWGKMPPARRRRYSIRLGTYTHDHALVRIHPALDQSFVPRFFVSFVVFHELLHHVVPARRTNDRIDYHTPEFRARERAHPDYERALRWEAAHIEALLRFGG